MDCVSNEFVDQKLASIACCQPVAKCQTTCDEIVRCSDVAVLPILIGECYDIATELTRSR